MTSQSRRDRTARLVRVAQILYQHPHGLSAREVAEYCGVCVRTSYRDLRTLQLELQYPVWQDAQGRYGLEQNSFLPPLKLTLPEAMALFLAARLASRYSDERDPNIESAFGKLAATLPKAVAQHVSDTVRGMACRHENSRYARVFDILSAGWAAGRRVRIWYPEMDDGHRLLRERLVEPYFLEPSPIGHSCYLIAHCHHAGAMRTFKLERIEQVELTDQPYQVPEDFDANQYLRNSWGVVADEEVEVRLRFSPAVASRVLECTWHPSQSVSIREDGSLDFAVTVAGIMEITPWIFSWGAEVEILAPDELRVKACEVSRRLGEIYCW